MNTINLNVHDVSEISIIHEKKQVGDNDYEIIEILFSGEDGKKSDVVLFSDYGKTIKVTKNDLKTK